MLDVYQRRKVFIAAGATEQERQTRRFVADYVLRDQARVGELADYCREHRVLRQTVALMIIEFHKALGWGKPSGFNCYAGVTGSRGSHDEGKSGPR